METFKREVEEVIGKPIDNCADEVSGTLKQNFVNSIKSLLSKRIVEAAATATVTATGLIVSANNNIAEGLEKVSECDVLKPNISIVKNSDQDRDILDIITDMGYIIKFIGDDYDEALELIEEEKEVFIDEKDILDSIERLPLTTRDKGEVTEHIETSIDKSVRDLPLQELPENLKNTFRNGYYRTVETTEDLLLFRVYGGGAKKEGRFLTTQTPQDRLYAKVEMALLNQWKNSRIYYCEVEVPKGTVLNIGKVGEQLSLGNNILSGGSDQILVSLEFASCPQHYKEEHVLSYKDGYLNFEKIAKKIENDSS